MDTLFGKLEFKGFEPTQELKKIAKGAIGRILGESPSDAASVVRMVKTKAGFEAVMRVSSLAGTFLAHATEADPISAIERLFERVEDQVAAWRRARR
jgi:ribosome-associated translation inhibitor RaiA